MQSIPSDHVWSPHREGGPPQGTASRSDNARLSPNIPTNQYFVGAGGNGANDVNGGIGSTTTINDNDSKNFLRLSPSRQTSPNYFRNAVKSGSGSSSPREHSASSIASTPLFPGSVATGSDQSPSPSQVQSYRDGVGGGSSSGSTDFLRSSAAASTSNEDLFYQRDPLFLPRRNHTIGAGTTSNRRRMNSHFQFPRAAPTSPGQNSLSAITGGRDVDDDDWETMIKTRDNLVPGEDDREELTNPAESGDTISESTAWRTDPTLFSSPHRRFPSQPTSAQATSPFLSGAHSPIASVHQRSESAHVRSLEQGPFASASTNSALSSNSGYGNFDAGMIRRHQSLNHSSGRNIASRLHASRRNNNYSDTSGNDRRSPVSTFNQERPIPPQSISPGPSLSGLSNTGDLFPSPESRMTAPSTMMSSTLMDAHARLARMSIQANSDSTMPNKMDDKKRLPSLVTNRDVLERSAAVTSQGRAQIGGPVSASAYVPPIGHGHQRRASSSSTSPIAFIPKSELSNPEATGSNKASFLQGPFSAMPTSNNWGHHNGSSKGGKESLRKGLVMGRDDGLYSNSSASLAAAAATSTTTSNWPDAPVPTPTDKMAASIALLQQRLLQQQPQHYQNPSLLAAQQQQQHHHHHHYHQAMHSNAHSAALFAGAEGQAGLPSMMQPMVMPYGPISTLPDSTSNIRTYPMTGNLPLPMQASPPAAPAPAVDPALAALIAERGYNPTSAQFNLNPSNARFFVIKSFTEDDVQRSLKHEIWASTEKGNQRLDKAFRECSAEGGGPLYLFFSVNASGHFCGMAQMMSALDYNSTSNVWVQEGKWKGTFKVRWIFVKDVPNLKLRHIKLINTAERKPITQSRDTQELPVEGGKEILRIMAEYHSKTTLLQDWLFYEQQASQQGGLGPTWNSGQA